jgi:hypothetical protein
MLRGLLLVMGVAVGCAGFATHAAAMSKWEKALLARYTNHEKCDGRNAPPWGRASMERWRAAQRAHHRSGY